MQITGWGKYPVIDSELISPLTPSSLREHLGDKSRFTGIARGMARSYGDSALASKVINTLYLNHFMDFDDTTGKLRCTAGVTLAELLQVFAPKGWFLPVTPGTKFVTVGGAVASDVHGKNHHIEGSFCDYVECFRIMLASSEIVTSSRKEHPELFYATCGGMGLTGIILDVTFRLKPIRSTNIEKKMLKATNLKEAMQLFEEYESTTYSLAWIDCLSNGNQLGRSLLMLGEHAESGQQNLPQKKRLTIPMDFPSILLNRHTVRAFNTLYYHQTRKTRTERIVHYEPFFYPLDSIHNWNRIYGKRGFTQYQFVIPKTAGYEGIFSILKRIVDSKRGSFLGVLKLFGKGNDNYLSFPMEGYTLALDFKLEDGLFSLLDELDRIVLDYGGRLYLTKDVRMSETTLIKGYPKLAKFIQVRRDYGAENVFRSSQSERLGI
jgi:FAD/FMN-containing dehydrogenase